MVIKKNFSCFVVVVVGEMKHKNKIYFMNESFNLLCIFPLFLSVREWKMREKMGVLLLLFLVVLFMRENKN